MKKKPTIKKLQKYQDSGYTKAPYNDPFASIFSNALGSGLYAYTNNNPFLNTHDSILGQPLSASVNNQGQFLGSLPMFQQLNKPLGSWDQESKGIENSLFEADGKKYGTAGSWKKTAEAWAKETGQDPRGYEKYVQDRAGQQYDSTVSAQKQWNEFGKPLAANMFALDELNTLSEKSYNQGLKLDAQDLTKGTKGQEFRGFFAKDGMRVGNFQSGGVSSFPYLSGMQDVPRSTIKDRKAQSSKIKGTLDNILEAVGINTGINAVSELSKVPALDTFYDLYNIADSYRQGDPFKATINEVGALIPGLSGKLIEAAIEDFIPKFPANAKKKMKFILKQSSGENMKLSEKYGQVYWDNPQFQKDYKDEIEKLEKGGSIKTLYRSMGADVGLPMQRMQSGGATNNLLSSIGVSQVQQDNSTTGRLTNLNPTDKLDYFKVLAGYVKQNGIEALKAHPVEFQFFTRTAEEVKAASTEPTQTAKPAQKEPPVDGGTYVEAEIKDKRKQEDKEETTTPKKTKRPDFSSKVGVTNAAQSFDAMLEYLAASSQDTQMSKDDYYNVLMQVEEDKRRQNPDSNIYTSARKPYSPSTSGQSELIRSLGRGSVNAFQSGGQINQLQQMLGYKDGSPFANLPFQTINSNSITMDGVSQPLLAIADNGERRVMQPNSGLHNFKGANSVLEVPMGRYQDGGSTDNLDQMYSDIPYLFGSPDYLNNKIINRFKSIVDDDKIERLPDIVKPPLRYLHKSNGSPMLVDNEGERSYYQTNRKTAHIRPGDIGDYLAELSHASQKFLPNRRAKDIEMVQKEFNTGKYKTWQDAYDAIMYTTPGTTEYEAHSEIQPKLEEEFMSYLDRGLWANHTTPEISREIKPLKSTGASKKKNGGKITSPINLSKNINPFRLSPINSFGLGGFIRDGVPSRPKSEVGFSRQPISGATTKGPMGPRATDIPSYNGGVRKLMDMPDNEYISTENLIPIQTERGEMIVMPTGDLVKVMATKRHHQMDDDEVTDVAPEGAYILSSFGKVRINRDEAEQVITETGVKPYRIGGTQDSPTEKNLGSMMTKKSMAPADIAKRVDRFFPVNSTNNPFELAANNENKTHRVPYLEGLIQLSELDKLRKGIDSGMESQQQENEDEMTEAFKNGGSTWGGVPMRNMLIPKFQSSGGVPLKDPWSTALEVGTGLFQVGADLWNSYQQRKAQKEFVKKGTLLSDQAYGKARNEMGMGYLAGMLGVMNQDPTVTAKYNDPTYLRQMQTRTPMSTIEAISNRAYANMPNYMQNAPTWQAGLGAQQAAYAAALKGANDARLTIGEQDRNAQNDWLKLMQTNLELNNNNRVEAVNATRLNRNQQVGAVGNQTQGYMDSLANATLGQLSNQLSLEGVRANANVNFSNNIANSLKGGINTIGTAGLSYLDSRNRTTTNNPNAGYGSGVGPNTGGVTWQTNQQTPPCLNGIRTIISANGQVDYIPC